MRIRQIVAAAGCAALMATGVWLAGEGMKHCYPEGEKSMASVRLYVFTTGNPGKTQAAPTPRATAAPASARGDDAVERSGLKNVLDSLCRENGVPYRIAEAIVYTESRWTATAEGHNWNGTKDVGLFQLNSAYWSDISRCIGRNDWDPYNVFDNMWAGVKYLAYLYRYWLAEGYHDWELDSMVISSYAAPTATKQGNVQWWYVDKIRQRMSHQ
jgi:soluble lytic murein transglycosylase-like protein